MKKLDLGQAIAILANRYPWGIYGLLPIGLFALAILGWGMGIIGLVSLLEAISGPEAFGRVYLDQRWVRVLLEGWRLGMIYAVPVIIAGGTCFFAGRSEAPLLWPTVGVFLVLFLGCAIDLRFSGPTVPGGMGQIGVGFAMGTGFLLSVRVLQLLIPLVLVLGSYYWWHRMQQDSST